MSFSNYRKCPVEGCQVVVFDIEHDISGIGDDIPELVTEVGSDNPYECTNCTHPKCLCKHHDLD
jgi:hypothetical protein